MARIRTIKPEFCTSEQVVNCSINARHTFTWMMCFCDDQGVHPASSVVIKMQLFPSPKDSWITEEHVQEWIDELLQQGLIKEFVDETDERKYWYYPNWNKHQKIEKKSKKFPAPPTTENKQIRQPLGESSANNPIPFDHGKERKGRERKGVNNIYNYNNCNTDSLGRIGRGNENEKINEPFVQIYIREGDEYPISETMIDKYQKIYPTVNVKAEFVKIAEYSKNNPGRSFSIKRLENKICDWLTRAAQDNAKSNSGVTHGIASKPFKSLVERVSEDQGRGRNNAESINSSERRTKYAS